MLYIASHLKLLGVPVRDRVTGFTGVVSSVSFDLYGCVQAVIQPPVDAMGVIPNGLWFDVSRLEIIGDRIMAVPSFDYSPEDVAAGRQGAAEKPLPR